MSHSADASIAQPNDSAPDQTPSRETVQRLLDLNRDFYAAISPHFNKTRGSIAEGMMLALDWLYPDQPALDRALCVLDAGCGNGRFARAFAERGIAIEYVGLDADAGLLASAAEQTEGLVGVKATFLAADLAGALPTLPHERYDLVASLAVLHHMPSRALRQAMLKQLANLLKPEASLLLSTWQFLDSERLAGRLQPWELIGLTPEDVEPGDALLPWDQGVHALRYVHQIDEAEVRDLAAGADLQVAHIFRADGKQGNLGLYAILRPVPGA